RSGRLRNRGRRSARSGQPASRGRPRQPYSHFGKSMVHLSRAKVMPMSRNEVMEKCYSYIRFSGQRQEAGDSYRRQMALAEEAALQEGVPLDQTLSLADKGISAFRGANWQRGYLGQFLDLVDAGVIAKGSILIIERVNRLSRLPWMEQVE